MRATVCLQCVTLAGGKALSKQNQGMLNFISILHCHTIYEVLSLVCMKMFIYPVLSFSEYTRYVNSLGDYILSL